VEVFVTRNHVSGLAAVCLLFETDWSVASLAVLQAAVLKLPQVSQRRQMAEEGRKRFLEC
jgi:hypothetical protein